MTASQTAQPVFGRMIPAMITPFKEDRSIDYDRAQELAVRLMEGGSDSLIIMGTTGECPTASYAEKTNLFKAVVEAIDGRIPVIANVGDNCTEHSLDFAQRIANLGISGYMCVVPYYNKPPQEGMYQHFATIAKGVELPIILYNIPGRCVVNMQAETTLRLARDFENIVAVKEASGKFDQIGQIAKEAPEGFSVYSGDDSATMDIMKLGGVGVISTIANVAPARMKEIVDLCAAQEWEQAAVANEKLMPLMTGLFDTSNPILVKAALALVGFGVGGVRLPLVDATPAQIDHLADIMREVGVL